MPAIPDLSDNSGGLSNPAYFNFASYVQWKAAARVVLNEGDRNQLHQAVGLRLADRLAPEAVNFARQAASQGESLSPQRPGALVCQRAHSSASAMMRLQGGASFMSIIFVLWRAACWASFLWKCCLYMLLLAPWLAPWPAIWAA